MYELNVMLTVRDRFVLTQKTIESIHETSKPFEKVNIYAFDNYSDLNTERFELFRKYLLEKKIVYYSYDTNESLANCFGKTQAHYRFVHMMKSKRKVDSIHNKNLKSFYCIIDNDIILSKYWADAFISGTEELNKRFNSLYYVTSLRPSITKKYIESSFIKSQFYNERISIGTTPVYGGSAFWFFDYDMLLKTELEPSELMLSHNIHKRHDSIIWNKMKKDIKEIDNKDKCGIIGFSKEPLILHMGNKEFGSICRSTMVKNYEGMKDGHDKKQKFIEHMSSSEVYENFKNNKHAFDW